MSDSELPRLLSHNQQLIRDAIRLSETGQPDHASCHEFWHQRMCRSERRRSK